MKLILIFSIATLTGCSIFKHKEYISIDSYPRGLEVKKNGVVIGRTPLFDKSRVGVGTKYTIDSEQAPYQEKCGLKWTDPLIEKIPLFKELTPDFLKKMMTTFTPINMIKGGKYECAHLVRYAKKQSEKSQSFCKKLLIIPPPANSSRESINLSQKWIDEVFKVKKSSCDQVISPKVVQEQMEFYGLNYLNRSYGLKYLMYGLIARLGQKFNSTHLVFLHQNEKTILPKVYDAHTRVADSKEFETKIPLESSSELKSNLWGRFGEAFKLIPNNFSVRFKLRRWLHLHPEESESLFARRNTQVKLPPSIVLSNIEYPLESWGSSFRFSPSVSYKTWDRDYDIKFASFMMVLKFFGHTPLGTFIGRLGGGLAYTDVEKLGGGYRQKQSLAVAQWGVEYYKFVSERMFLKLGFRRNELRKNKVVDGSFHLKGLSELFVGVGFYTPELNSKIKSFIYD